MVRRVLARTGLLFLAITAVSFGLYFLFYFAIPTPEPVMSIVAPVFGLVYYPAIWLAMTVTGSDFPLFSAGGFALLENLLIAAVISFVTIRDEDDEADSTVPG